MKNRIKAKINDFLIAGLAMIMLLAAFPVYGEEQQEIFSVKHTAEWTNEEEGKGNILIEITGIGQCLNENTEQVDKKEQTAEEITIENENIQENTQNPALFLTYFLSEYFSPDIEHMPKDYMSEEIEVIGEDGGSVYISKISVPVFAEEGTASEKIDIVIPILLKEEYCLAGEDQVLPVNKEASWQEIQGSGIYLVNSGTMEILSALDGIYLEKKGVASGFQMNVYPNMPDIKAGQTLTYEVTLKNTGEIPLSNIRLQNNLSQEGLSIIWQQAEGLAILDNGKEAVLEKLEKENIRKLYAFIEIPEEQQDDFNNIFYASCQDPISQESVIESQVEVRTSVTALRVEYTVEKTADRTEALPGDTIRYQICIRNTGERAIHSVLSTERFQASGIQAQFLEKDGVELNAARNQALIPQILPGEAFALEAAVVLPVNLQNQELINEVTVKCRETGEKTVQSQAGIQVGILTPTPTPYQLPTSTPYQLPTSTPTQIGGAYKNGGVYTKQASSSPKTGDMSQTVFWTGVLGIAAGACIVCFCIWKGKRKR